MLVAALLRLLAPLLLLLSTVLAYQDINPPLSRAIHDPNTHPTRRNTVKRDDTFKPREASPLDLDVLPRTNAERLARGLPLIKARFGRTVPGKRTPTPVNAAKRNQPSQVTHSDHDVKYSGVVVASDADKGTQLGYVRAVPNSFGEYTLTDKLSDALRVTFKSRSLDQQLDVTGTNTPLTNYPFVGGITGYAATSDNFASNSYNYAYIGGSERTPGGSAAKDTGNAFTAATTIPEHSESAIWSFDSNTLSLWPQWINTDLTKPTTIVAFVQDVLVLIGDFDTFQNTFGPTKRVNLKFMAA